MIQLPIKRGDKGDRVIQLQQKLVKVGANMKVDGDFGPTTEYYVQAFQAKAGLLSDGIVGNMTWDALCKATDKPQNGKPSFVPDFIEWYPLNQGQYVATKVKKVGEVLHHTVSDGNPFLVVDNWNNDSRGAVGTQHVIGREMVNSDTKYDGMILQTMENTQFAYHVLTERMGFSKSHNYHTNSRYMGVELCSWGCLKKEGNAFFDLSGKVRIPEQQVCTLERPFRTFKYWHKFTDAQLHSLYKLLQHISQAESIDFSDPTFEPETIDSGWFEMDYNAMLCGYNYGTSCRKLLSHTTLENGKFDVFPQPELIEVIKSIYKR